MAKKDETISGGKGLDALCKHFGIAQEKREKHDALADCKLTAKIYMKLTQKK